MSLQAVVSPWHRPLSVHNSVQRSTAECIGVAPSVQLVLDDGRRVVGELAAGAAQEARVRDDGDDALRALQRHAT